MTRRPPRSTSKDTLLPVTTRFRALGAARQHLGHHGVVVAGGGRRVPDLELAVGVLLKSLGAGHDHAAVGLAALGMAVVVDLDALGRAVQAEDLGDLFERSEEHTSELQSLMRISYAVFCLKKKTYFIDDTYTNEYI